MNRRDMFTSIAGIAAASGVTVQASTYDVPSTKPALAVLELQGRISSDQASRLAATWELAVKGTPFEGVKVFVLDAGCQLTFIDKDGHVLNRTVEIEPNATVEAPPNVRRAY